MSRILHSILLAALVVGGVLWNSFNEVNADNEYLTAAVVESNFTRNIEIDETAPWRDLDRRRISERPRRQVPSVLGADIAEDAEIVEEAESEETETETKNNSIESVEESVPVVQVLDEVETKPEANIIKTVTPATSESYDQQLAQTILKLLNKERVRFDLPKFKLDSRLTKLATQHSEDMADEDYLDHADDSGCVLTCRLKKASYKALAWAENLVLVQKSHLLSTTELAEYMLESWMKSGTHRQNLLNEDYTHVGIGIARDGNDVYVTTDFALPK